MSERFKEALQGAWKRIEERQWVLGNLGRKNSDGTYTFVVPGRPTHVYVTIRQGNGAQTVVSARNDADVPYYVNQPVRMKLENGVYVIYGKSKRPDQANVPAAPPTGLPAHNHDDLYYRETEFINASTGVPDAGKPIVLDPAGLLDPSLIHLPASIDAADEQVTLEDTNSFPLTDTGVLKWASWATIKAALTSLFDTLYSAIGHDHDGVYSLIGHDHAGVYSLVSHDHAGVYSLVSHNHDGAYVALTGNQNVGGEKSFTSNLFALVQMAVGKNSVGATYRLEVEAMPDSADAYTVVANVNDGIGSHRANVGYHVVGRTVSASDLRSRTIGLDIGPMTQTASGNLVGNQNGDDSGQFTGVRVGAVTSTSVAGGNFGWANTGIWVMGLLGGLGTRFQYGLRIGEISGAVLNYGIYVANAALNYINGALQVTGDVSANTKVITPQVQAPAASNLSLADSSGVVGAIVPSAGGFTYFLSASKSIVLYETVATAAIAIQLQMTRATATTVVRGFWATVNMVGRIATVTHAGSCRFWVQGRNNQTIQYGMGAATINITVTVVTQTSTNLTLKFAIDGAAGTWNEFTASIVADSPVTTSWTFTGSQVA